MAQRLVSSLLGVLARVPWLGGPIRRRAWYPYRHHAVLLFAPRENVTFTQFMRLPRQCDALVGPVVDFLLAEGDPGRPLKLVVYGCSNGAEAYTIASVLATRRPDIDFRVHASDIERAMIDKALAATYPVEEVARNPFVTDAFLDATFVRDGASLRVRPALRERVSFEIADLLDPAVATRFGPADIVVAQNFLYHLDRRRARIAFRNLCATLGPRSALFVDGMDIDMRETLTRKAGLMPLDHLVAEIHGDAMTLRGGHWPWQYWSLEPLDMRRKDRARRYATIFLREAAERH